MHMCFSKLQNTLYQMGNEKCWEYLFEKFNLFYFIIITNALFSFFLFLHLDFSKIPCKEKSQKPKNPKTNLYGIGTLPLHMYSFLLFFIFSSSCLFYLSISFAILILILLSNPFSFN